MRRLSLIGRVFGKLKVDVFVGVDAHGHSLWECTCECGTRKAVIGDHLVRGNTASCGCAQGLRKRTHGMWETPEYAAYTHAKSRCENLDTKQYDDYGARGIQFRFSSFEEFFKVLGKRPLGKTLDRIDNEGHYEAGNVRWATRREQLLNTRRSIEKLMRTVAWG